MIKSLGKTMIVPIGLAGATLGLGELGEAFDSDALTSAGETTGKFIAPAIGITMGGFVINQLKDIKRSVKSDKEENRRFKFKL